MPTRQRKPAWSRVWKLAIFAWLAFRVVSGIAGDSDTATVVDMVGDPVTAPVPAPPVVVDACEIAETDSDVSYGSGEINDSATGCFDFEWAGGSALLEVLSQETNGAGGDSLATVRILRVLGGGSDLIGVFDEEFAPPESSFELELTPGTHRIDVFDPDGFGGPFAFTIRPN